MDIVSTEAGEAEPGFSVAGDVLPFRLGPGRTDGMYQRVRGSSSMAATRARSKTVEADDTPANRYDFSQQIGHLLRRAYQTHLAIFQQNASDPQLTSVQFVTLCALRDHGASSQAELVKATKIDQATIRGIVDRLKARGFIRLTTDSTDRRKIIMSLTRDGEAVLVDMVPCARKITELTMAKLNPAERAAALFVLRKMIEPDDD